MRSITVILLASFAILASGSYMTKNVKYADKEFLEKQKFIFDMLQHVFQDEIFEEKYMVGKTFKFEDFFDHFEDLEKVKLFWDMYLHDPVPVGEIFYLFTTHHYTYAKYLVYTFMYAKDWDTFYKTVLWARFHVNKPVFVYALSFAAIHRPDMQGIILPPIYEIYPQLFFSADTIQKAQHYKMQGFYGVKPVEDVYTIAIPANYSGMHGQVNFENKMSYFTEDIGLNSFYYYWNLDYPFWTKGKADGDFIKDRRGEFFLNIHSQLLARYYMERLSNDLPEIEEFHWDIENFPGYFSGLRYYGGMHFPDRENDYGFYHSGNFYYIDMAYLYSHRIMDVIDFKYAVNHDGKHFPLDSFKVGLETLGNLLQGNEDSLNFKVYGSMDWLLRTIINEGYPAGSHGNDVPGVLYHYETSMRDPAFYFMYKYLTRFYWHFMDSWKPYTKDELHFDGVKIESVEMDKLITYFDKFDADITNIVDVEHFDEKVTSELYKFGRRANHHGHDFLIKARQYRLNHLPFNFKLNIHSDKAHKATVKVFIGPKFDYYGKKIDIEENRKNFYELDYFMVDLVEGKNVITRNSNDFSWFVNDRTTYFELYKKLWQATTSDYKFPLDMSEAHCGFPNRLMLPKGKKGGMPFQFFFFVAPYHEPEVKRFTGYDPTISCGIGSGARYMDDKPFIYPLDRKVDVKHFYVENMYFYDTYIFHKSEADVNAIHY